MRSTTLSTRSTAITSIQLNGLRVLNTRPQQQARDLSRQIRAAGGIAIEYPTIQIMPLAFTWLHNLAPLASIQKAIFVSTNAVTHFFAGLQSQHIPWPTTIQTFAIGTGTATALNQHQITAVYTPKIADSEHLLALSPLHNIQHQSVLIISGEKGRPLLDTSLRDRGAIVHNLAVYRRVLPEKNVQFTHALWQDDGVDIILMLSQEAMDNLFALFEEAARPWLLSKPWVVISPRLVDIARRHQVRTVILSSYEDILTTLRLHEHGRNTSD